MEAGGKAVGVESSLYDIHPMFQGGGVEFRKCPQCSLQGKSSTSDGCIYLSICFTCSPKPVNQSSGTF